MFNENHHAWGGKANYRQGEDICHANEVTVLKMFGMIPILGELWPLRGAGWSKEALAV